MPLILLIPESLHHDCQKSLGGALRSLNCGIKSITGESARTLHDEVGSILSDHTNLPAWRWLLIRPALGCVKEWWCAGDAVHWAAIDGLIAVTKGLIVEYELEYSIDEKDELALRLIQSDPALIWRLISQIKRVC